MDKKGSLFEDDAAFISEVNDGVSQAPNMDPHLEIERLLYRYKMWQKDFKMRLKATQASLKRQGNSPSPYASNRSSSREVREESPAISHESGGFSARIKRLANVGSGKHSSKPQNLLYGSGELSPRLPNPLYG